ncbi:AMP-binding protein [Noviherbaspirillum saxi]|uniref:AMP-binding protein n=1 Tax=Noviherbaspirillum saxi TaxID=2320863 RepID=A0A3A3FRW8_9BURK|nr:AMP-binding protein [Noviherbaspirillum saxi]RJF97208.1 AMP-binding protein [Noviherbaspirillum saxi]
MSDFIDILNLLSAGRSLDSCIGWREDDKIGFAEFLGRVSLWHTLLLGTSGSNFALYANDSIEFAAALFGAWHAGKTIYLPSDTLPATCASLRPAVQGYLGDFPAECAPISPDLSDRHGPQSLRSAAEDFRFTPLQPDFPALVVYTSGSTGLPQAIPKKLSQLACEVATLERQFGSVAKVKEVVATVSHQHIYGLLFKVLWPLASERGIHARSRAYPEELLQLTSTRDCILISSPAHLKRLPESPAWAAASHRICTIFSSGGPLPEEVAYTTVDMLGAAPIEIYGSSETGGIGWRQRKQRGGDESWQLLPEVDARIASEYDALEVRSSHLPDNTWFRTADRANMVSDSRFFLQGRADRIVKIEEKRISLDLIELRLKETEWVADARVLVVDGKRQRLAAFIVLTEDGSTLLSRTGKPALNDMLRRHLAQAIERIALPRSWRYLDALPINAQGKTTHGELMALLEDLSAAARPVMPRMSYLERDTQRVLIAMTAPRDLLYFDGHFAGVPILPGVAQVEWAQGLARQCFDLPPLFKGIHALKFQQVIRPERPFSLEMMHDAAKSSVTFKYFSDAGVHASGRLMFGAADV